MVHQARHRRWERGRLASWLGCGLCALLLWGQAVASDWPAMADTLFRHFSHEQGIPHPVVTAISQTGDGFIWIGTENGLARWDGYRFRAYSSDAGGSNGLPDNSVTHLYTDRQGQLWLFFNSGNMARYDARQDQFVLVPLLTSAPVLRLLAMVDDGEGGLLVGTSAGLARVTDNGAKVVWLRQSDASGQDVLSQPVLALERDAGGRLWLGTVQGVWLKSKPAAPWQALPLPKLSTKAQIGALQHLQDGRMLIGSLSHGVLVYEPKSGTVTPLAVDPAGQSLLATGRFVSMLEVRPGEVWFGSHTQGIMRLDLASGRSQHLQHDPGQSTSLPGDAIQKLFLDRSGLLWVGTQRGLSLHDPTQMAVLTVFSGPGQPNHIQGPDVRAVLALTQDRILLGLSGQGMNQLDPEHQSVTPILPSIQTQMVQGICHVPSGDLYFATESGVVRTDSKGEQPYEVPRFDHSARTQSGVAEYFANRVWVGSVDGLWQLDPGEAQPVLRRVPGTEALSGATVRSLAWDGKDSLWIGSNSFGLYHYAIGQQRLSRIRLQRSLGASQFTFIASLLVDDQGRLWVGSQGDGIAILPNASQPDVAGTKLIGNAQGLPNLMVNRFVPDDLGHVWASTDGGLAQIDPKTLRASALHRADGVQMDAFWAGSGSKTRDGDVIFGGAGGITVVRPKLLSARLNLPSVVLTNLQIGGVEVWRPGNEVPLQIQPRANSFTVEFAALDYAAPEHIQYAYRLEGYDGDWIKTPATRRLASYTNLPPGEYRLHLLASNRKGDWGADSLDAVGPNHLVLQVRVLPYWWQTWWLRALCVVLAGLLLLGLIHARTRWLNVRRQELEQQVAQRTMELDLKQQELLKANQSLNLANTDLAQSLDHLKDAQAKLLQQEKLASIGTLTAGISHEINNPSNFAHVGAYNLSTDLAELHDFLWQLAGEDAEPALLQAIDTRFDKLRRSLAAVQEGTTRIRDLVRDLRTFSRLDMAQWLVVPISDGLRATVNLVRTQYAADIEIRLDIEDDPELLCWPAQLNQVFMNLIVNACQAMMARPAYERMRRPGLLHIHSKIEGAFLRIDFSDNGPGIAPEIVERIFDPFFTTKTVGEGMGMGLAISHGIMEKHHGSITVDSTVDVGTCFSLRLPLAKPE